VKIAAGADDSSNLKAYSKNLIKRFDTDSDGFISIQELCDGLKKLNIYLTDREREGLMRKLDIN
jgi:Ca2+-binding EF-hand superfamily protein